MRNFWFGGKKRGDGVGWAVIVGSFDLCFWAKNGGGGWKFGIFFGIFGIEVDFWA